MTADAATDAPNYTRIPNCILDSIDKLTEAELRIALVIARKTFGWHKERDTLSLTQLEGLTGMSRQGVAGAVKRLIKREIITRIPSGLSFAYQLAVVNVVDQSTSLTSQRDIPVNEVDQSSQRSRPEVVNEVDTQKKAKETNKRKRSRAVAHPPQKTHTTNEQAGVEQGLLIESDSEAPPMSPAPPRRPPKLGPVATALAEVCRIDTAIASKGVMIALHNTAKTLSEAGRTADQVTAFGDWWKVNDWRGKKGDAPKFTEVQDAWGSFAAAQHAPKPAASDDSNLPLMQYRPGETPAMYKERITTFLNEKHRGRVYARAS